MRIKKTSATAPIQAQVLNANSVSEVDAYSCNYIDTHKEEYSTDEKVIGTWIDGKPLYRKVIIGTTTTKDASFSVSHGVSDYDIMMIDNKSFVKSEFSGSNTFITPINCPPNTSDNYNNRPVRAAIVANNITVYIGSYNGYNSYDYAFIIEYTKTTD